MWKRKLKDEVMDKDACEKEKGKGYGDSERRVKEETDIREGDKVYQKN